MDPGVSDSKAMFFQMFLSFTTKHITSSDKVVHLGTYNGRGLAAFLKCVSRQCLILPLLHGASLCGLPFWASSKRSFSASH